MSLQMIHQIGDVHLGRVFKTGVPNHRLGEREEMVWRHFEKELDHPAPYKLILGDLFDTFIVSPTVVLRAYDLIRKATLKARIIILRGNHDASRDTDQRSSFDVLMELCGGREDVTFVTGFHPLRLTNGWSCILFGWHPFVTTQQMATTAIEQSKGLRYQAAFGHWDTQSYGGEDHNLIPIPELTNLLDTAGVIFTGHEHRPSMKELGGRQVRIVGSMQPYSHGEELNRSDEEMRNLYQTLRAEQVHAALDKDELVFQHINVRILVAPGQVFDRDFDCLSCTFKQAKEDEEGQLQATTTEDILAEIDSLDGFDIKSLLPALLEKHKVSDTMQASIIESISEKLENA